MSTKTLRKRIALVAVAALGAGLLSVAPATAGAGTAITNNDISMTSTTTGTNAIGVCYQDSAATDGPSDSTVVSTKTVVEVGAKVLFTTVTNGTGSLVIEGPAKWSAVDGSGTISSNRLTANIVSIAAPVATLTASAAGALTVTAYSAASGGGTAVETYGITVVDACAGTAIAVSKTVAAISVANDTASSSSTDASYNNGEDNASGQDLWINVLLRDAYGNPLTTAGVLTATATNGAKIGWVDGEVTGPVAAAMAVTATLGNSAASTSLQVKQGTTGAALNTTVTIQFNGVTVATKTIVIHGVAASIAVTDVTVGDHDNWGEFRYVVKDAAGNQIKDTDSATAAVAGFVSGGTVTSAYTEVDADFDSKGYGYFACASGKSGSQSVTLAFLNSSLKAVTSNAFTATCGLTVVDTFTVSTDKAVYSPGEIATLTISAKDENGGIVSDYTQVGAAVVNIAMPGMTAIGAAASSSDTFTSGKKTYKFRVDQAEGSFVGQAQVTADTDTTVKTLQYQIKLQSGAVSNADVLKAIVSLIASINKQIAALQKALLKKK